MPGGTEAGDQFGYSSAAGDFNKDGVADFALAGGNGLTWAYGFQEGTVQARRAGEVTRQAVEPSWSTVAAGDINKDGYADLAWQTYESDGSESFMYFLGSATDLQRKSIDGMASFYGPRSQAIADVNGDGYGDLIIGRPYNTGVKGGAISIRPGTSKGLDLRKYYTVHQGTPGVAGTGETGDGFGVSVAARDLNGDGRAEVAVGIPGENGNTGTIALLRGSSTWSLGSGATIIHQSTSGVPGGSEPGDRFGREVAFNDHNGDGRFELAVGVPGENGWDGAVVLLKGVSGGVTTTGATAFCPASVGGLGRAGWFAASFVR